MSSASAPPVVPVAIIGGGLVGLHAARLPHEAGVGFRLFEARDRLGGRILTTDAAGRPAEDGFDLGPSWFWPEMHLAMAATVAELARQGSTNDGARRIGHNPQRRASLGIAEADRGDGPHPAAPGAAWSRTGVQAMKVAVMGAGSVGCYFGGLLARAGTPVTLIGRRQHVDAVTGRGLLLEIGRERHVVPMPATTDAGGVADADLVLFCVKSGDTEAVGREIAPHLRPDVTILSLQNGVDNADRLQAVLGRAVVPVAVYVATEMSGPGHVRHHGRGELVIGPCSRGAEIVARFGAAGIPTRVSESAIDALWAKLIVNCAYNALSALTQLPYGRMLRAAGVEAVMRDIVAECVAVAEASGVSVPPDILPAVLGLAATMPEQTSSTAQDMAKGKPTEIDHLNGFVVRRGAELGIPTPVNRVLHTLVKATEAKGGGGGER